MQRQPAVHPHISSFRPAPVLVEQVLLPQSVEQAFARLTSWQSLPALIPVSPMLEPVRGRGIYIPSEPGDMLIGRGHTGGVEQVYLVVSAVSHLLWTVVARPLRDDGGKGGQGGGEGYQLTIAFSPATGGQCLVVVQIVGAGSDVIDGNGLRTRLERIRAVLAGSGERAPYARRRRAAALSMMIGRLLSKVGARFRKVAQYHGYPAAAAG